MSYQVIARKFRPQNFDHVKGQDHIARTLKRAIETGRIHHAYLFTGARGVGKTSTARILAKCLNCEKGPTPNPCGQCKSCTEITQGISLDVREIDGASNTGVDDIRQLREDVRYLPNSGKYRIYIIDEIHMLSTSAFNALLKTLEEPPEHVIFIFATTEPHKILETILSRCQRYDFRLLSHYQILDQLRIICEHEKIAIDSSAMHLLAQEAAGSMRDAETLLEQVIPFATDTITAETITQSLGLIDRKILWDSLEALLSRQTVNLMAIVRNLYEYGYDIKHFSQDLLTFLRHLCIFQVCHSQDLKEIRSISEILDLPDNELKNLEKLAGKTTHEESQRLFQLLSKSFFEITHSPNPRFSLEMTLLRMSQTPPLRDIATLIEEIQTLKKIAPSPISKNNERKIPSAPAAAPLAKPTAPHFKNMEEPAPTTPLWTQIIEKLKSTHRPLSSSLMECQVLSCTREEIIIGVPPGSFLHSLINEASNKEILLHTVKEMTGQIPRYEVRILKDMPPLQTPGLKNFEEKRELSEKLKEHPVVKDFQAIFDAQIEDVKKIMTPSQELDPK